jgi:hypothetical protein
MNSRSLVRATAVPLLLLLTSPGAPALAGDDRPLGALAPGAVLIAGSWSETTSVPNGPTFAGLLTFTASGTVMGSYQGSVNAGPPSSAFTASHGQWVYEGNRTYSTTALQVVSDFSGQLVWITRLRQRLTVSRSGQTYRSVVRAEFYDGAGTLLFASDGATEGRRITVEPLR